MKTVQLYQFEAFNSEKPQYVRKADRCLVLIRPSIKDTARCLLLRDLSMWYYYNNYSLDIYCVNQLKEHFREEFKVGQLTYKNKYRWCKEVTLSLLYSCEC